MAGTTLFPKTKGSLQNLERLITCTLCKNMLSDPYSFTSCGHTFCRSCIVDALSSCSSKCPECNLPGWLKDLKSNKQLANMSRLLTSMKKQVSSTSNNEDAVSTFVSDSDQSSFDGASCNLRSEVECDTNQHEYKIVLVKPRVEASLIEQRLKSSMVTEVAIPKLSSNENESLSTITKSCLCLNTSSPLLMQAPSGCKSTAKFTIENTQIGIEPWKVKHSSAEFGLLKHKEHQSVYYDASPSRMDTEFPCSTCCTSISVASSCAHGARQCLQGSDHVTFPRKAFGQRILETSEGDIKSPSTAPSSNQTRAMHRNIRGETPLHIAAIKGDVSAVRALLQQGAEPNAKDNAGWTPLHEACNHGHIAVATVLLDNGAFVNVPGFDNDTPLHDAVVNGHVEVAALLISRGANCNLRNSHGTTPRDLAITASMSKLFTNSSYLLPSLVSPDMLVNYTHQVSPQLHVKGRQNEVVLLGTGLKLHQKNQLEEVSSLLGARVVESFSSAVSHVIAVCDKSGCCPRTLKFLYAVASGKWIVNFKWICRCLQEGSWVNEEPYEVQGVNVGDSAILSEAPRRGRYNRVQQAPGLFDGCEFYFTGDFPPPGASKEDLVHLVRLSGGKILSRQPKSSDSHVPTHPFHAKQCTIQNTFIIYDPCTELVPPSSKVATVPASWLLDCLSYFELIDLPNV